MSYYEELVLKLDELQKLKKYAELELIINEELKAPYIPKDVESKLNLLLTEVKQHKLSNSKVDRFNIDEYLFGDTYQQQLAIHFLKDTDLDSFHDLITSYLLSDKRDDFKKMLLVIMIERKYNHTFQLKTSNQHTFTINPISIKGFLANHTIVVLVDYFEKKFYNNPTFLKLAVDLLNLIYIHQLPQEIKNSDFDAIKEFIECYLNDNFNQNHQNSSNSYYYHLIFKDNN